ncbi:MAG: hypothetical protein ACTS3F_00535 [Phycisphaerales bacterium]
MRTPQDLAGLWVSADIGIGIKFGFIRVPVPGPDQWRIPGNALLLQRADGTFRIAIDTGDGNPAALDGAAWSEGQHLHRVFTGPFVGGNQDTGVQNLQKQADRGTPARTKSTIIARNDDYFREVAGITLLSISVEWERHHTDEPPDEAFEAWLAALRAPPGFE